MKKTVTIANNFKQCHQLLQFIHLKLQIGNTDFFFFYKKLGVAHTFSILH